MSLKIFVIWSEYLEPYKGKLFVLILGTWNYDYLLRIIIIRIKGKVEQAREWSSTLPYTSV